jgi:hypothetical protein
MPDLAATALSAPNAARVVHQHSPQLLGCNGEKMSPIFPVDRAGAAEPQVHLVHKSRGLQGVFSAFAPHLTGCDSMQLAVHEFHELGRSSLVASTPFPEKAGDHVRIFCHNCHQSIRELFLDPATLIRWGETCLVRQRLSGRDIIPDHAPQGEVL